jgi:hypothetical protein
MSNSKSVPVVSAYAPGPAILKDRPNLANSWLIPCCPFCSAAHVHAAGEGRRQAHCPTAPEWLVEGTRRPNGYTLKFAGETNDPKLFDDDARRKKAKYAAYLKAFEDRSKARRRQAAHDQVQAWPAETTLST